MSEDTPIPIARNSVIAAVVSVAATYVYFLVFAEFALIELAKPLADGRLPWLMGTLAAGGVAGSFAAARAFRFERYARSVANGFRACGAAAAIVLLAQTWWLMMLATLGVGLALGWLTVTLVSGLRGVLGGKQLGLWAGLATGSAYAICNLPWVFEASAANQTILAALVAVVGALSANWLDLTAAPRADTADYSAPRPWFWLAALLALVWLDSAAFYIIQHTDVLRSATWTGAWTLGGNALMHLAAAVAAGLLLDRGGSGFVIGGAFLALAGSSLWLGDGSQHALGAEVIYTAGVSLYSTALITYPAHGGRPWLAARIYAIAGWGGSALGIGMAQDLHHVPFWFCAIAGVVVFGSLALRHWGSRRLGTRAGASAGVLLIGTLTIVGSPKLSAAAQSDPFIEHGRQVYLAEGCIHCHSQYVRPQVANDRVRWGPVRPLAESLAERPPLFGNRRQGPDLTRVGNRRTAEWNRLHLTAPRSISPGSRMPSYAHLFRPGDPRGDALVAYLGSLGADTLLDRILQTRAWMPVREETDPVHAAPPGHGATRFGQLCAPCHGADGRGDGPMVASLSQRPPSFGDRTWRNVQPGLAVADRELTLARIIKFGVPGTTMAGHESLDDATVVELARTVEAMSQTQQAQGP